MMSASVVCAFVRAASTTGRAMTVWLREATSETTPPKGRWRSIWVEISEERRVPGVRMTAAAVSSQEVSRARIKDIFKKLKN